jgi:hypothetical protein
VEVECVSVLQTRFWLLVFGLGKERVTKWSFHNISLYESSHDSMSKMFVNGESVLWRCI